MNITDQEIIENIKKGNNRGLYNLRNKFFGMARHIAMKNVIYKNNMILKVNEADINDLMHDTFYIIISKIKRDELVLTVKLSTYFYAVFEKMLKRSLIQKEKDKKFRHQNSYLINSKSVNTDKLFDENVKQSVYEYYFNQLSDKCKEIFKYYYQEFPVSVIANLLGNTVNYIMKRKYECKERLVRLIKTNPDKF